MIIEVKELKEVKEGKDPTAGDAQKV